MQTILDTLKFIPPHWPLTVVNENKQPLGYQWQHHPFRPAQLYEAFNNGFVTIKGKTKDYRVKPQGFGVLCGKNSQEFLFSVDIDGESAYHYLQRLGEMPLTVAFTSGRRGRCQYLLSLPLNQNIKSFKVTTAPGEALEIRGTHHQSVLPPSPHPITGQYQWVNSPAEVEVAVLQSKCGCTAPDWLVEWINQSQTNRGFYHKPPKNLLIPFKTSNLSPGQRNTTSIEGAIVLLNLIPSHLADDYHCWIRVGMALKYISPNLLDAWDKWSQQSSKYKPGECEKKWDSFRGTGITQRTLHYLARN